jgi:hypothetical protein
MNLRVYIKYFFGLTWSGLWLRLKEKIATIVFSQKSRSLQTQGRKQLNKKTRKKRNMKQEGKFSQFRIGLKKYNFNYKSTCK